MLGERAQRQVDRFLDEAEEALARSDWATVLDRAQKALSLDPENADGLSYRAAAERSTAIALHGTRGTSSLRVQPLSHPTSFADGRYHVVRFLGEGGKKRVYLARDAKLDREVAFALLKSDGLDADGLVRIRREAQAMARLGDHPHIVAVFDIGEEMGQPYLVCQYMAGGDVQGLLAAAANHQLAVTDAVEIADQVCQALEHAHRHRVIHRDLKPGNVWLSAPPSPVLGASPRRPASPARGEASTPSPLAGEGWGEGASVPAVKLGDFGLAFALDHSRLTQAGTMVGTVTYMAPEQASGGQVSARSDLYALGCLLYEMVCGRPPFVGDDSIAIIGQHLNTPPVAPTWHRADCPPGLEALILRLLEKDPAQRPASAAEVRKLLATAAQGAESASNQGRHPGGDRQAGATALAASPAGSPLYRATFVGREHEVRQARAAFDAATSGRGALVAIVGEPGIGKTALCEQLATYVGLRGGRVLVGHCYEEGSLSLPYLPFVEALRSYVLIREPDALREELGSGAADVARIVTEVRDRVQVELRPSGDPDDDRWRLFQAVTGFLRNAASVQPLVVVLEDLHWADRGTLELLLHVARNLQGARLLLVGTYRDVEVDRAHPLSATLAELRRIGDFARILLRGLSVDEVSRMMNIIRGQEVPWSRAEAIHRQTEGNPLFVQEVLRYLVEEGLVVREGGRYLRTDGGEPDSGIPEGLRDVVGRRLSRLSDRTNQVLSVAAVIGRDFRLDVLQRVAGSSALRQTQGSGQALSEEDIDDALKEAVERAIVEERSALGVLAFRFTHAFFRQTLYEEIFASQRLRLHQQVARALESLYSPVGRRAGASQDRAGARPAGRLEEHASELAEHFAQSTDPTDLQKALDYSELAAQRAMSVFAYSEAARHLEQALKIQNVLDPDDASKRCDLLLALGEAMLPLEEPRRVADTVAEEAFALAEALDDSPRAARAAVQALEGFMRTGSGVTLWQSPEVSEWVVRADLQAQPGTLERVYADVALGFHALATAGPAAAHVFLRRAVQRALDLNDNAAFFAAAAAALVHLRALMDCELREQLAHQVLARPHEGARSRDVAQCLNAAGPVLLGGGEREPAEAAWREEGRLAERTRDATLSVRVMDSSVLLALIEGRLEEVLSLHEALRAQAEQQLGVALAVAGPAPAVARALMLLGRTVDFSGMFEGPARWSQAHRAVILAHLGQADEARALRARFGDVGSDDDSSGTWVLLDLLEASVLSHDVETVSALVRRLAPLAGRAELPQGVSIGRLLGDGARLLGHPDEARDYYAQALEVCEKIRFRPEIALIRLAQAELLLDGDQDDALTLTLSQRERERQRGEAREHLEFAIGEFRAMKMQPSLERALALKESLKASNGE